MMVSFQAVQSKVVLRYVNFAAFVLSVFIVIFGSFNNVNNHKYVRALGVKGCQRPILNINEKASLMCCDHDIHFNNIICQASFNYMSKILSSSYAHFIPFIPLIVHLISELILNVIYGVNKRINFEKIAVATVLRVIFVGLVLFFSTVSMLSLYFLLKLSKRFIRVLHRDFSI